MELRSFFILKKIGSDWPSFFVFEGLDYMPFFLEVFLISSANHLFHVISVH